MKGELPRFSQPRFYDLNVCSAKKVREKLENMHANPEKRGFVEKPGDWVSISFGSYEKSARADLDPFRGLK